jgi:hypothetical protein
MLKAREKRASPVIDQDVGGVDISDLPTPIEPELQVISPCIGILLVPKWKLTLEWLDTLTPLVVNESVKRRLGDQRSTELRRRARMRATAAATAVKLTARSKGESADPPPTPAEPTEKSTGEAVADAINVAHSIAVEPVAKKNVRLAPWIEPTCLALPPGTIREPWKCISTEFEMRRQRRLQKQLGCPLPLPAPLASGPPLLALTASPHVGGAAAAPSVAAPLAPSSGASHNFNSLGAMIQHLQAALSTSKGDTSPSGANVATSLLVSYNEGLAETIRLLQSDTVPPAIAVRDLWRRLSAKDQSRFSKEFPQFMHYVQA